MTDEQVYREALVATLTFLITEQSWEWFRAEMLYGDDEEKQRASEKNAELLRQHVRDLAVKHKCLEDAVNEATKQAARHV